MTQIIESIHSDLNPDWENLNQAEPGWDTVKTFVDAARNSEKVRAGLLAEVERQSHFSLQDDEDSEWRAIHSIRILTSLDEERLIPLCLKITEKLDEEWDLIIQDVAEMALERLAKPERFEIYWTAYERTCIAGLSEELEWSRLATAAACRQSDRRLTKELRARFEEDPARVASMMMDTQDPSYVPLLEAHLREIAPVCKYVPYDRFRVSEHNEWIEVGGAWLYFKRKEEGRLRNWEKRAMTREFDLEIFYRKQPEKSASESKELYQQSLKEVAEDREELAAKFMAGLPERWEPLMIGEPSETDLIIAAYLRLPRKVGRNDPCPCGSGKKHKKCCGG